MHFTDRKECSLDQTLVSSSSSSGKPKGLCTATANIQRIQHPTSTANKNPAQSDFNHTLHQPTQLQCRPSQTMRRAVAIGNSSGREGEALLQQAVPRGAAGPTERLSSSLLPKAPGSRRTPVGPRAGRADCSPCERRGARRGGARAVAAPWAAAPQGGRARGAWWWLTGAARWLGGGGREPRRNPRLPL